MAAPSGISAQFGYKLESTYGTAVTVDRFVPLLSESLEHQIERVESDAIRAGRYVLDSADWIAGTQAPGGSVELELYDQTVGGLFTAALGSVATSGADPYTHTFTPGSTTGKSLTVQVGKPDISGTVTPFTYAGCKVSGWSIDVTAGELAKMSLDLAAQSVTTGTALAAASYDAALRPWSWADGALTIGGTAVPVSSASFSASNPMADARYFLGSDQRSEPLDNGLREITGEITVEFDGLAQYERFVNGTTAAVVLAFTAGALSLTITANCRFDGSTPTVSGRDLLSLSLPVKCVGTSDAAAFEVELVNNDATA